MTDATTSELAERLGDPGLVLLDVRRPAEFLGEVVAPCDPRAGHIPGARNVDVADLLAARDVETVLELVAGSRSAMAVQVLAAAGYEARNYVGSWHEWSRDPSLPAALGG